MTRNRPNGGVEHRRERRVEFYFGTSTEKQDFLDDARSASMRPGEFARALVLARKSPLHYFLLARANGLPLPDHVSHLAETEGESHRIAEERDAVQERVDELRAQLDEALTSNAQLLERATRAEQALAREQHRVRALQETLTTRLTERHEEQQLD